MHKLCGIDEAGRGPLAGPVTAAAVILPTWFPIDELADSKALPEARREHAAKLIREQAVDWGIGWAWPEEIDRINIHNATLLAMKRAYNQLRETVCTALVDGKFTPSLPVECRAIVKGDSKVPEIMAASILAKVARDRWMVRYSWIESRYGFDKHKGYPTVDHRRLYAQLGPSAIHRRSFSVKR